jgi:hypothetical protein
MFWDLLSKNNNLQMQISDFEDEETIKAFQAIIERMLINKSIWRNL